MLRGMDGAAFFRPARYQLFAEVFELREALTDKLGDWGWVSVRSPQLQAGAPPVGC